MLCDLDADNNGSTSLPTERPSSFSLFAPRFLSPENEPLANATDFFEGGARLLVSSEATLVGRPR